MDPTRTVQSCVQQVCSATGDNTGINGNRSTSVNNAPDEVEYHVEEVV
uniref:Uncharacterized protein n=1 Tax=Arundo donax TaxID=35708 RepID=A0A0A9BXZ9_ARUDO